MFGDENEIGVYSVMAIRNTPSNSCSIDVCWYYSPRLGVVFLKPGIDLIITRIRRYRPEPPRGRGKDLSAAESMSR